MDQWRSSSVIRPLSRFPPNPTLAIASRRVERAEAKFAARCCYGELVIHQVTNPSGRAARYSGRTQD